MAAQDFLARPKMHYVRVNMLRAVLRPTTRAGMRRRNRNLASRRAASGGLSGFVSLNTRATILRCTITCSHCVLNRQIDAYPAYGRHRVGGISVTKMALSRVVDFPYHCTFSVTPAIARCFVTDCFWELFVRHAACLYMKLAEKYRSARRNSPSARVIHALGYL